MHSSPCAVNPACESYEAYLDYFITHTLRQQRLCGRLHRPHSRVKSFRDTRNRVARLRSSANSNDNNSSSTSTNRSCDPPSRVRDWCRSQNALASLAVPDNAFSEPADCALTPTLATGQSSGGHLEDLTETDDGGVAGVSSGDVAAAAPGGGGVVAVVEANLTLADTGVGATRTMSSISDEMNYMSNASMTAYSLPRQQRAQTSLTLGFDATATTTTGAVTEEMEAMRSSTITTMISNLSQHEDDDESNSNKNRDSNNHHGNHRNDEVERMPSHHVATNSGIVRKPQKSARPVRRQESTLSKVSSKEKVLLRKVGTGSETHVIRVIADNRATNSISSSSAAAAAATAATAATEAAMTTTRTASASGTAMETVHCKATAVPITKSNEPSLTPPTASLTFLSSTSRMQSIGESLMNGHCHLHHVDAGPAGATSTRTRAEDGAAETMGRATAAATPTVAAVPSEGVEQRGESVKTPVLCLGECSEVCAERSSNLPLSSSKHTAGTVRSGATNHPRVRSVCSDSSQSSSAMEGTSLYKSCNAPNNMSNITATTSSHVSYNSNCLMTPTQIDVSRHNGSCMIYQKGIRPDMGSSHRNNSNSDHDVPTANPTDHPVHPLSGCTLKSCRCCCCCYDCCHRGRNGHDDPCDCAKPRCSATMKEVSQDVNAAHSRMITAPDSNTYDDMYGDRPPNNTKDDSSDRLNGVDDAEEDVVAGYHVVHRVAYSASSFCQSILSRPWLNAMLTDCKSLECGCADAEALSCNVVLMACQLMTDSGTPVDGENDYSDMKARAERQTNYFSHVENDKAHTHAHSVQSIASASASMPKMAVHMLTTSRHNALCQSWNALAALASSSSSLRALCRIIHRTSCSTALNSVDAQQQQRQEEEEDGNEDAADGCHVAQPAVLLRGFGVFHCADSHVCAEKAIYAGEDTLGSANQPDSNSNNEDDTAAGSSAPQRKDSCLFAHGGGYVEVGSPQVAVQVTEDTTLYTTPHASRPTRGAAACAVPLLRDFTSRIEVLLRVCDVVDRWSSEPSTEPNPILEQQRQQRAKSEADTDAGGQSASAATMTYADFRALLQNILNSFLCHARTSAQTGMTTVQRATNKEQNDNYRDDHQSVQHEKYSNSNDKGNASHARGSHGEDESVHLMGVHVDMRPALQQQVNEMKRTVPRDGVSTTHDMAVDVILCITVRACRKCTHPSNGGKDSKRVYTDDNEPEEDEEEDEHNAAAAAATDKVEEMDAITQRGCTAMLMTCPALCSLVSHVQCMQVKEESAALSRHRTYHIPVCALRQYVSTHTMPHSEQTGEPIMTTEKRNDARMRLDADASQTNSIPSMPETPTRAKAGLAEPTEGIREAVTCTKSSRGNEPWSGQSCNRKESGLVGCDLSSIPASPDTTATAANTTISGDVANGTVNPATDLRTDATAHLAMEVAEQPSQSRVASTKTPSEASRGPSGTTTPMNGGDILVNAANVCHCNNTNSNDTATADANRRCCVTRVEVRLGELTRSLTIALRALARAWEGWWSCTRQLEQGCESRTRAWTSATEKAGYTATTTPANAVDVVRNGGAHGAHLGRWRDVESTRRGCRAGRCTRSAMLRDDSEALMRAAFVAVVLRGPLWSQRGQPGTTSRAAGSDATTQAGHETHRVAGRTRAGSGPDGQDGARGGVGTTSLEHEPIVAAPPRPEKQRPDAQEADVHDALVGTQPSAPTHEAVYANKGKSSHEGVEDVVHDTNSDDEEATATVCWPGNARDGLDYMRQHIAHPLRLLETDMRRCAYATVAMSHSTSSSSTATIVGATLAAGNCHSTRRRNGNCRLGTLPAGSLLPALPVLSAMLDEADDAHNASATAAASSTTDTTARAAHAVTTSSSFSTSTPPCAAAAAAATTTASTPLLPEMQHDADGTANAATTTTASTGIQETPAGVMLLLRDETAQQMWQNRLTRLAKVVQAWTRVLCAQRDFALCLADAAAAVHTSSSTNAMTSITASVPLSSSPSAAVPTFSVSPWVELWAALWHRRVELLHAEREHWRQLSKRWANARHIGLDTQGADRARDTSVQTGVFSHGGVVVVEAAAAAADSQATHIDGREPYTTATTSSVSADSSSLLTRSPSLSVASRPVAREGRRMDSKEEIRSSSLHRAPNNGVCVGAGKGEHALHAAGPGKKQRRNSGGAELSGARGDAPLATHASSSPHNQPAPDTHCTFSFSSMTSAVTVTASTSSAHKQAATASKMTPVGIVNGAAGHAVTGVVPCLVASVPTPSMPSSATSSAGHVAAASLSRMGCKRISQHRSRQRACAKHEDAALNDRLDRIVATTGFVFLAVIAIIVATMLIYT